MILAAMVNVISLRWVQHKTKPKKVTTWRIRKVKTPLFQATSCSLSKAFKYNFLKRCNHEKINNKSTPLSWSQKKSSVYKSSKSSSSLTIGTIIGSGIKLNDTIVPLKSWENTVKRIKNPNNELASWKLTVNVKKYFKRLDMFVFRYGFRTQLN